MLLKSSACGKNSFFKGSDKTGRITVSTHTAQTNKQRYRLAIIWCTYTLSTHGTEHDQQRKNLNNKPRKTLTQSAICIGKLTNSIGRKVESRSFPRIGQVKICVDHGKGEKLKDIIIKWSSYSPPDMEIGKYKLQSQVSLQKNSK
uniref:NADH dehydrogenase [ubiquinone] 1 alpha subcomplex assembly factor 3 n=1 Tax=Schistocephalus solidus TaxID=70667 RepID=A0A0V0JCX6_SCHSO